MANKVIIASDSTCDLSKELIKEFDVKIVPLHINFDEKSYDDNIDINLEMLYRLVDEKNELPKTAALTPGEFYDFCKKYIDQGYDIFFSGISSKLSVSFQNALLVASEFENRVFCVDSQNLSTGIGLLILKACKLRDQGLSAKEIADEVSKIVPRVKSQFVINTLDYLYKGGRCSGTTRFIGSMLNIKPMIVVRKGEMTVGKKFIGSLKKSVRGMVDLFLKDIDDLDPEFVFITHTFAYDKAEYIKEMIKDVKIEHLYETIAGCVIGSHCGPNTIGILYILKDKVAE